MEENPQGLQYLKKIFYAFLEVKFPLMGLIQKPIKGLP